jgi:alkylation response protein AidB-like acyl-CoA dehydrogenase
MTDTASRALGREATAEEVREELRAWLASTWDPDLTVAEWWDVLADSGWAVPTWPQESFGRGLSRDVLGAVAEEFRAAKALGPPGGLSVMLAGPTIVAHGSEEQKRRYLRPIVNGQESWCQLFSEPGAGSDLASLAARAVRDGDEWVVNGQKVWTSGAQVADLGMVLTRTNPDVPKHSGISYFAIEMDQPGVEVRPLREMTGRALFNEVFLTDARVRDDALIGGENNGWTVANTTLANERVGLGAGAAGAMGAASPGKKLGHLERRAGDFVRTDDTRGPAMRRSGSTMLVKLAQGLGRSADPVIRQQLAELHTLEEIARYTTIRAKAAKAQGKGPGPEANLAKMAMSRITRLSRDLGLQILGPGGMLHGADAPLNGMITEMALFSPAVSIYGGTDEVQRNVIGERVLGLPKEPNTDKVTPFKDLKKS